MSDISLFRYSASGAKELAGKSADVEKTLQSLIESQMETFLGVRFLASEYDTGAKHRGRIDSLGLDENGCPVIVEYKRTRKENVINQGLFYLDWLLDHKAEFRQLVIDKLGPVAAEKIEWKESRVLCIAADFDRYDLHAISQIGRNIELIRYKLFGDDLLLIEQVNGTANNRIVTAAEPEATDDDAANSPVPTPSTTKTHADQIATASPELLALFDQARSHILAQGDDIIEKPLKLYVAFRRLKNFVCMSLISKQDPHVFLILKLDPQTVALEPGFTRDVSKIGHWGTGDLEVTLRTPADFEKGKALIERAYQEN